MRVKISVITLTVALILGLSLGHALAYGNVTYLGKTTFTVSILHSTVTGNSGSFPMTGALSKVGDEFYLFQGYVTPSGDGPFVVSGSGFKTGSTLIFTLAESQNHANSNSKWRDGGVMHVEIDTSKNPWTGTFYDIGHDFDTNTLSTTPNFNSRYTDGTVSGSPVPLNPSVVAPQSLLLQ